MEGSRVSSGFQTNISSIQFGMSGAFLIVFTNVKEPAEVRIGKRIEIPTNFSFENMYISEERREKLVTSGTWYIYRRKPIRDKRNSSIIGYRLVLIRGSKTLCFAGDGEEMRLSEIGKNYNIPGFYEAAGSSTEGFMDIMVTLYKNVRIYRMVVNSALVAADIGFIPIFWPDGSVTYEKVINRGITDAILQEAILNAQEVPIMKTSPPDAGRVAKNFTILSTPPFIIEYKISPATIIEIPSGLIYDIEEEAEVKEYYIVRDLLISLEGGKPVYMPTISKIYITEIEKTFLGQAIDNFIQKTKNVMENFFKVRKNDEENNQNQQ